MPHSPRSWNAAPTTAAATTRFVACRPMRTRASRVSSMRRREAEAAKKAAAPEKKKRGWFR